MKGRDIGLAIMRLFVLNVVGGTVWSQSAPELINFQGRLNDEPGQPLGDGTRVDFRFVFYGAYGNH